MDYKYTYDSEADVLAYFLSKKPFEYASEIGDFIVHFDKKDTPVYVEILNASQFLIGAAKKLPKSTQDQFLRNLAVA